MFHFHIEAAELEFSLISNAIKNNADVGQYSTVVILQNGYERNGLIMTRADI